MPRRELGREQADSKAARWVTDLGDVFLHGPMDRSAASGRLAQQARRE
jgi:hypothetical protein